MNLYVFTRSLLGFGFLALMVALLTAQQVTSNTTRHSSVQQTRSHMAEPMPAVVLAAVTVRPSAEEMMAALRDSGEASQTTRSNIANATAALPRLIWDMPYYSFGNVLPRVTKD